MLKVVERGGCTITAPSKLRPSNPKFKITAPDGETISVTCSGTNYRTPDDYVRWAVKHGAMVAR